MRRAPPQCEGRECGPDQCGGSCGTCDAGSHCNGHGGCVIGHQAMGEPCTFGNVNETAGDCQADLECVGIIESYEVPCSTDADCSVYPEVYNPDCVTGAGCGVSLCVSTDCANCPAGYLPQGTDPCYCLPELLEPNGQDEPCPWQTQGSPVVNEGTSGGCFDHLTCLGGWTGEEACATDSECAHPEVNPDCVDGGCGFSFCAAPCVGGLCDVDHDPIEVGGDCYCAPHPTGSQEPGEPCSFDMVNPDAGYCVPTATCMGINPMLEYPCSTEVDCEPDFSGLNPDCVGGACGVSFCAGPCADGACGPAFEPVVVSDECFCFPDHLVASGALDAPCEWQDAGSTFVNEGAGACHVELICQGSRSPGVACAEDADCPHAELNADCAAGACAWSLCAAPCDAGTCVAEHHPVHLGDYVCYCFPDA